MAQVTIYTSPTCRFCTMAKDYLTEKGVEFTEKNVAVDQEAVKFLMSKGHRGVPVIYVDDEEIVGFDQNRLDQLLNLN